MSEASWSRVELFRCRVIADAELRVAPDGSSMLRVWVECGEGKDVAEVEVLILGEEATELKRKIMRNCRISVKGSLKTIRRTDRAGLIRSSLCVMASNVIVEEAKKVGEGKFESYKLKLVE